MTPYEQCVANYDLSLIDIGFVILGGIIGGGLTAGDPAGVAAGAAAALASIYQSACNQYRVQVPTTTAAT